MESDAFPFMTTYEFKAIMEVVQKNRTRIDLYTAQVLCGKCGVLVPEAIEFAKQYALVNEDLEALGAFEMVGEDYLIPALRDGRVTLQELNQFNDLLKCDGEDSNETIRLFNRNSYLEARCEGWSHERARSFANATCY